MLKLVEYYFITLNYCFATLIVTLHIANLDSIGLSNQTVTTVIYLWFIYP